MRQMAPYARQPLPVRSGGLAAPALRARRPLPQAVRLPRLIGVLLWLYRLLLVQPVGRRARDERLGALPDRTLRDIGLKRVDVHAAAWGRVRLRDVVRAYPSAGPLYVCGRPGFRPTLVRLSEAA
jgi:uncharacterized protein YjiS (DUF1127 family)